VVLNSALAGAAAAASAQAAASARRDAPALRWWLRVRRGAPAAPEAAAGSWPLRSRMLAEHPKEGSSV
jgi:hypothetical protein